MRPHDIKAILNFSDREGITLDRDEGNMMVWREDGIYLARLFPSGKIVQASSAPDIILQVTTHRGMTMRPDVRAELNRMLAEKVKEDAAVTHTQAELVRQAKCLLSWAKRSRITKVSEGSVLYRKGSSRLCSKIYPQMVADLLKQGLAIGDDKSFVLVADKIKEL